MVKYIIVFLFSLSFAVQAQTQQDYDMTGGPSDITKSVHIYPNPAVDFVHIRLDRFSTDNIKLTVHNIIGNQVEVETEVIDEHEIRVRVKDLSSGYYLLALKDDQDRFKGTYKFLKR
jgi:hypothetical protein